MSYQKLFQKDPMPLAQAINMHPHFTKFSKDLFTHQNKNIFIPELIRHYNYPESYDEEINLEYQAISLKKLGAQQELEEFRKKFSPENLESLIKEDPDNEEIAKSFEKTLSTYQIWNKYGEAYSASHILIYANPEKNIDFDNLIQVPHSDEIESALIFFLENPFQRMRDRGFYVSPTEFINVIPSVVEERYIDYLQHSWK